MSYFKRFTNFCGGFVAFAAMIHLIGEYMTFKALDAEGLAEKLKAFFDVKRTDDHRGYVFMIALFVLSVIIGRIFERVPYISLAASLLPLYQTVQLYSGGKIEKFPELYLFFALLHTVGNIVHALVLDRADGRRRGYISAAVLGTAMFAGGVWVWQRANAMLIYKDPSVMEDLLGKVDFEIAMAAGGGFQKFLLNIALMIAASVIISFLLRDIYFLDAIIAVVPLAYAVDKVLLKAQITVFGSFTVILCALYFAARVALVVFEPMRASKNRKKAGASVDKKSEEMV